MHTTSATHGEIVWSYLEEVRGVALLGRVNGEPMAIIELCPQSGFRLTNCAGGQVSVFQSLDEAKAAAAESVTPAASRV